MLRHLKATEHGSLCCQSSSWDRHPGLRGHSLLKSDLHLNPPNTGAQGGCSPQVVEQQHSHRGTYIAVIGNKRTPASAVGVDGHR